MLQDQIAIVTGASRGLGAGLAARPDFTVDDIEDLRDAGGGATAVQRGLVSGCVVSSGFLRVFGAVGLLVVLGLRSIIGLVPWAAIVIGVAVAALGMEAIHEFEVKDMPVTVAVDVHGTSVHNTGPQEWKKRIEEHALEVK